MIRHPRPLFQTRPSLDYEGGPQRRDLIYVDDSMEAIRLARERKRPGFDCLNADSGAPTSVLDVARLLIQALGRDVPVQVTGQSRAGDIRHAWADMGLWYEGRAA